MDVVPRMRAWLRARPPWVADALLAGCLAVLQGSLLWTAPDGFRGPDLPSLLVTLVSTLPVAARRLRPGLVLAVVGLGMVAAAGLAVPAHGFGLIVALYTCAAWSPKVDAVLTLAVFGGFTLVALVLADGLRFAPVNLVIFLTAWVFGDRRRAQRLRTEELERRAAALERERDVTARLATARERARIAQELHDVVAHGVTAMVTQSAAAERLLERDPARAEAALLETERTGRASLAELRRLLGLLRAGGETALQPQPGLEDVEALVAAFGELGVASSFAVEGPLDLAAVPRSIGLGAYRVVQEGLTNVLVHANARRVHVRLLAREGDLVVEVVDDGLGPPPAVDVGAAPLDGQGLLGLRERVLLLGGTLASGRRPEGGYVLEARLPLAVRT